VTTGLAGPDMLVDVVVPLFRPGPWLRANLDSIREQRGISFHVWLIDDDPASDLRAAIAAEWPDFTYVRSSQNSGFARACNRGLSFGSAPFVLVVNQDSRLEPGYLAQASRALIEDPSLAAAGGLLLRQNDPESPPDGTIDTAGIAFRRGRRAVDIGQGEVDIGQYSGRREVFGVCAAAAVYRRSALSEVADANGVFDERFFMYKEDVDLAWRLRRAGYRAVVHDAMRGYHARGARPATDVTGRGSRAALQRVVAIIRQETAKDPAVRRRAFRNQILMIVKNESLPDLSRSFWDIVVFLTAQTLIAVVLDPLGSVLGRVELLARLPHALQSRRGRLVLADLRHWLP
jgi:GT2 family glycosyltransferase